MKLKVGLFLGFILSIANAFALPASGQFFNRVIFVVFENTNYQDAIRQPFFLQLAQQGVLFKNLKAITHPSQGNYVALTSGSLNGVKGDGKIDLDVNHIADLMDSKGVSWKVYAEDYPGGCFLGTSYKGYARKHNPFISYVNIQKDSRRCANIVNAIEFDRDAASGTLPQYVFYVPNIRNDGHDTGVKYADGWYRQKFSGYFSDTNFMRDTLVVSTFDENAGSSGNLIYTSFFGPMVQPNFVVNDPVNLYSLLKLIEDNWSLGSLGKQDTTASPIPNVWK